MIEIQHLFKAYGDLPALTDLSLTIPAGEIFAFLGPNGAGKTTTIKLLCGLLAPDRGTARIAGYDVVSQTQEAKTHIGLVPDEPYVYPKLTGWEFLELIAGMYRLNGQWTSQASRHLDLFELGAAARSRSLLEGYSHGMKQKIVLTSVLMRNPKVWLLDEPLVGLDPKAIRIVKSLFLERARQGASIFLSTHVLSIAEELADRVGIIMSGRLQFVGTKKELSAYLGSQGREPGSKESLEDMFLKATLREKE